MRGAILITSLLAISTLCFGQRQIALIAKAEPTQVVIGNYCKVSYTLQNSEIGKFTPPPFTGFDIVHKETASSYSFGMGGFSKNLIYQFYIRPRKTGNYTLNPASVKVGNRTYRSKSLTLRVVKPGDPGTPEDLLSKIEAGKGIFLLAQVNPQEAYLGQQIILEYKLYTSVGLERYNIISEPAYPGFYAQEIQRFQNQVRTEKVEGQNYRTKVLQRQALFPQKTGLLRIEPLTMNVNISLPGRRNSVRQTIASEPVELNIKSLPKIGQPKDFSGAVGRFDMQVKTGNPTISTDDALKMQIILSGTGDVKQISPPNLNFGEEFEIYDPEISEETFQRGGFVSGSKTFEYLILPKKPGNYELNPKVSYFDSDSLRYIALAPQTIYVDVGLGRNPLPEELLKEEIEPVKEMRGLKTESALSKKGNSFFASLPFWILFSLPFGVLGLVGYRKRKQTQFSKIEASELRKMKAVREATKRLTKAAQFQEQNQSREFFEETSHALWGYVADKMDIAPSELSKDLLKEKLSAKNIPDPHVDKLIDLIKTCELALFAGADNSAAMQSTYDEAKFLIVEFENVLS